MAGNGRCALVVGASRGLGLGLAAELQRRGWNVVGTVRDDAGERRLKGLAGRPGGEIRVERRDGDIAVAHGLVVGAVVRLPLVLPFLDPVVSAPPRVLPRVHHGDVIPLGLERHSEPLRLPRRIFVLLWHSSRIF